MPGILYDKIIEKKTLTSDIFKLTMESECIARSAMPGQFVNISCSVGTDTILRRPVSICTVDRKNKQYEIVFQTKGQGTMKLAEKQPGSCLDVLGPLGVPFVNDIKYRRIAVVGGGIGIFPLLFLLEESYAVVKRSYLGFRNKDYVIMEDEFGRSSSSLEISTDDGSYGYKGLVTALLERDIRVSPPDIIYACGPLPMLRRVAQLADTCGVPCQVSLEQRMGCGFGACLVCACKTKQADGWKYSHVCKDGPVFWSSEVIFDD